jgi:hypothetical protein
MAILFTNNAAASLSAGITSADTSLTVNSGQGALFPNPSSGDYFLVTLQGITGTPIEIVQCTARSGDTLTIVRAQEGTTASAFIPNDLVQLRITAAVMQNTVNNTGNASAGGVVYENGQTITSNYTMSNLKNGFSVGPINVNAGVTVTIPSGSRWLVM